VGTDVTRHLKVDVVVETVPDGAIFVVRQRNRAFDRVAGNGAFNVEPKIDLQESMRILLGR
jgi:hypothetical protein